MGLRTLLRDFGHLRVAPMAKKKDVWLAVMAGYDTWSRPPVRHSTVKADVNWSVLLSHMQSLFFPVDVRSRGSHM